MNANRQHRIGAVIGGLVALFLLVDTITHLLNPDFVRKASDQLGLPQHLAPTIGLIELVCLATFVYRRTAIVGAVLLTGYLGGAVAVNLRAERPIASTTLFPVYVAIAIWVSLYLRDVELRNLLHRRDLPQPRRNEPIPTSVH